MHRLMNKSNDSIKEVFSIVCELVTTGLFHPWIHHPVDLETFLGPDHVVGVSKNLWILVEAQACEHVPKLMTKVAELLNPA